LGGGLVGRHPHDEPINVGQRVTATGPTRLEGPLAGDQLPTPAKQRVRVAMDATSRKARRPRR